MALLKDLQLDPEMQKLYEYYASQCGLGPYPTTPTNVPVTGIGSQLRSVDRRKTVIPNYQKEIDAYKIPPIVQSPTEAALARSEAQYKRTQGKNITQDFSQPKPKKKNNVVKKHITKKSTKKNKKKPKSKKPTKKSIGKKKTVSGKTQKRKTNPKRKLENNLNFHDIFSG